MYQKEVLVVNKEGLHAKSAADFVIKGGNYLSGITICKKGSDIVANAKSIVFVLSLEIHENDVIVISGSGVDEKTAVDDLANFVNQGFK